MVVAVITVWSGGGGRRRRLCIGVKATVDSAERVGRRVSGGAEATIKVGRRGPVSKSKELCIR